MQWLEAKELLLSVGTPVISDALDKLNIKGVLDYEIKPVFPCKMAGFAVIFEKIPSQSNFNQTDVPKYKGAMQEIIDESPEESVLIVATGNRVKQGACFGGLNGIRAKIRGFSGVVCDGPVRDVKEMANLKLPLFARGITPESGEGRHVIVSKNITTFIGNVKIEPGDIVIGDEEGIVIIPSEKLNEIVVKVKEIREIEEKMETFLKQGKSLVEAFKIYRAK